ncbi:hypothetical protein [Siminovitchia sp. 179-K 8D1 HS]|uniref:hypothetical protein n=1 Tax=Siminovitchia sp. 179-K 8D1 HS TaxID=3142385 RepID=UPI00399FB98E
MDKKIKEILNRNIEEWGDISLSQFESDINLLKQLILSLQSKINSLEKMIKPRVNLNDLTVVKAVTLEVMYIFMQVNNTSVSF